MIRHAIAITLGIALTFAISAAIRGCQEWTPTVHVIHSGTIKER